MKARILFLFAAILFCSCQPKESVDILITHAEVIDVETGEILSDQMIGIREGVIAFISDDYSETYYATTAVAGNTLYFIGAFNL